MSSEKIKKPVETQWMFLGSELGLKQKEIARIISSIQKSTPKDLEFEKIKFFASDSSISEITNELMSASLFSSYRLVHIEQVEVWKAADAKEIIEALKLKDDTTFVILSSDETRVDNNLTKYFSPNAKKTFWALSESEYINFVLQTVREMGYNMYQEVAELVVEFSGVNTLELQNIIKQIITFKKQSDKSNNNTQDDTIRQEDIQLWLSHNRPDTVFNLFEDMAQKNYRNAFEILATLHRIGEHPAQIMAGMIYQIKNALRIKQKLAQGEYIRDIFQSLNIRNFTTQKYYNQFVAACSIENIEMMLELCAETESELRSRGEPRIQEIIMSRLIYQICMFLENNMYSPLTGNQKYYYNISNTYLYDW